MTPERQTPNGFSLFPLSEESAFEARTWLQSNFSSPDVRNTEIEKLKNSNFQLYVYIYNMGNLRRIVQFGDDEEIENAYWNGAFFMQTALKNQYENLFKDVPDIPQSVMKTHFFNLLDVENNHCAIESMSPGFFSNPDQDFAQTMSDFWGGYRTENFDELVNIFAKNSDYYANRQFDEDAIPELKKILLSFVHDESQGPPSGLFYGAYDIHEIFRIYEEGKEMERKWEIQIEDPHLF